MTLTVDQWVANLQRFKKSLAPEIYKILVQYATVDAAALITNRVINKQISDKGTKFSRYSRKPMLTSGNTQKSKRVWRAMASSRTKRRQLNWVTIKSGGKNVHLFELKGGYSQLRKLEGFSNTYKSFEFTGQMWRGFGVKRKSRTNTGMKVVLGGRTAESQKLIDINSKREGMPIIGLTKQEIQILEKAIDSKVIELLKKFKVA